MTATATATTTQVVKVQREKLMACMTCPLCNNIFTDATTISECLHTFCRNCIYEKITGDELDCCPVCNINLGCVPLEKLRADHNMEDLREKIFPCKRKNYVKAAEITLRPVPLPAKRKERSLSSLVISELNATAHSRMRTPSKSSVQKNLTAQQWPTPTITSPPKLIFVQNKENDTEMIQKESEISNQRIQIFEEASVTRLNDCSVQLETVPKSKPFQIDSEPILDRVGKGFMSATSGSVQHGKLQDVSRGRRLAGPDGLYFQAKGAIDVNGRCNTISNPIWFSLVASDYQEGDEPLPQISSRYLRVRDGSLPVSFIQKYLVKKLGLASDTEVEISFKGKPVSSTIQLHDVVDLWRKTTTKTERIQTSVGSSAKDFVMVLSYGRKAHPHENSTNWLH